MTSLQARYVHLPASPSGLLGGFAPSGFVLCNSILSFFAPSRFVLSSRILSDFAPLGFWLCAHKNYRKKVYLKSTQNALKKKSFTHLTHCAKPEQRSTTVPTPYHPLSPKEYPCQVSCRLVQNCGR